jgi:hypothetical protein
MLANLVFHSDIPYCDALAGIASNNLRILDFILGLLDNYLAVLQLIITISILL